MIKHEFIYKHHRYRIEYNLSRYLEYVDSSVKVCYSPTLVILEIQLAKDDWFTLDTGLEGLRFHRPLLNVANTEMISHLMTVLKSEDRINPLTSR